MIELELGGIDDLSGFGAVVPQIQSLACIGFWLNCMYRPGTLANIAAWCKIKEQGREAGDRQTEPGPRAGRRPRAGLLSNFQLATGI